MLAKYDEFIWYFKPVQSGYGKRALDYVCCIRGLFVCIETKAPGEDLTRHQVITAAQVIQKGGGVWIISQLATVDAFEQWIQRL